MKKINITSLKHFICSIICTCLLFFLFIGLVIADRNTRLVGFGDRSPLLSFITSSCGTATFSMRFFNHSLSLDLTPLYLSFQQIKGGFGYLYSHLDSIKNIILTLK